MAETKIKSPDVLHPYNGVTPPLREFLPFVRVNDEETRPVLEIALGSLYKSTADIWRPGWCHSVLRLNRAAYDLQQEERNSGIDARIMTYGAGHHFFLEMTLPKEEPLIIDPFGVPAADVSETDWMADPRLITPFFGNIEQAPPEHQRVYREAQPGYRAPFRA